MVADLDLILCVLLCPLLLLHSEITAILNLFIYAVNGTRLEEMPSNLDINSALSRKLTIKHKVAQKHYYKEHSGFKTSTKRNKFQNFRQLVDIIMFCKELLITKQKTMNNNSGNLPIKNITLSLTAK